MYANLLVLKNYFVLKSYTIDSSTCIHHGFSCQKPNLAL